MATILAGALFPSLQGNAAVPGPPQERPIALVGGTVHPVSGPEIVSGTVLFDGGQITGVGTEVAVPADAERIDVAGKHVYPGLFAATTQLGLTEIGAARATHDYRESGSLNPNARAEIAINPDTELIPVTRSNGVLLALAAPQGGLVAGTSAVIALDGWTWEELTLRAPACLHIQWPSTVRPHHDQEKDEREKLREKYRKQVEELQELFDDARAYAGARRVAVANGQSAAAYDARLEALLPVLDGEVPVMVQADRAEQIQAAVTFAVGQGVRLILLGGYDAPHCAKLLREHDVAVIVSSVFRLPLRRHEPFDEPFTLPERLRTAGIRFCIANAELFHAPNTRNLPYHAAMAVAYGLPAGEGLKAITLYPAEILGIADRVGSLEVGKEATLFVADGDPLETTTRVQRAYVQGRRVDLTDRHKQLWSKYREKYRRLGSPRR